jgi:hypothetical protein
MKKRHSAEQIVLLLWEADVELGKGGKVPEVCRKLGDHPADVLPLADEVRLDGAEAGQTVAGIQRQVKRLTDRTEPKQLAELSRRMHSTARRAA